MPFNVCYGIAVWKLIYIHITTFPNTEIDQVF